MLLRATTRGLIGGLLVHHKIRHGATQTVIVKQQVQQVQVNEGGQAVVAGWMKRSRRHRTSKVGEN
jgi:hypothetical protein